MTIRKKKGRPGDLCDDVIAGIVLAHHATLATPNTAHFENVSISLVHAEHTQLIPRARFLLGHPCWIQQRDGRKNWIDVNNDINSPDFLGYSLYNGRAFTGRIRFLGRK